MGKKKSGEAQPKEPPPPVAIDKDVVFGKYPSLRAHKWDFVFPQQV
jgi:hypothetical protein